MYLAIDIGGTKTLLAVFTKKGELKESIKFKTPVLYDEFRDELAASVAKLSTNTFSYCVVAAPGKIDRTTGTGIAFGNLAWANVEIGSDVKRVVNCEVVVENDGNLAGLYEARQVPQYKKAMYITISTGIGGVVVNNGKIEETTQDAEIGHMLLERGGKLQRWQEFASGKAIVKKYGKKASEIPADATGTWYVIARNIAIGMIDVIATLTPEVIIIGGGVGTHFAKFGPRLIEELKIYDNALLTIPAIVQAKHPEEAVVYGCYEMAKDNDEASHSKTSA